MPHPSSPGSKSRRFLTNCAAEASPFTFLPSGSTKHAWILPGPVCRKAGGVGFEIFDKQSLGITDFVQKVNYLRAMQGELSRTVASLSPVSAARVHLALPQKRLFKSEQQRVTASIIVKLAPGRALKETQVQGIVNLVAGSVEGLEPEYVTVVDAAGKVLSKKPDEGLSGPMTPGMLEYQRAVERQMESRASGHA